MQVNTIVDCQIALPFVQVRHKNIDIYYNIEKVQRCKVHKEKKETNNKRIINVIYKTKTNKQTNLLTSLYKTTTTTAKNDII